MNSKDRILTALKGEQPDRVPIFELYINEPSIVKVASLLAPGAAEVEAAKDRFGEERVEILDLYCLVVEELGLDATCSNFSIGIEPIDEDHGRDKFGTLYYKSYPEVNSVFERAVTAGIEFPFKENVGSIMTSFELGTRGDKDRNGWDETYMSIGIMLIGVIK